MSTTDTPEQMRAALDRFRADFLRLRQEVSKVIVGQLDILDDTLMALIAGGHVLLEGVPGLERPCWCGRCQTLCISSSSGFSSPPT